MTGVSSHVPPFLEYEINCILRNQGLSEESHLEIKQVNSQNNVLGSAYTVSVKDGDKCLNLFVKCVEDKGERSFSFDNRVFFHNEVLFYGEFLETFKNLWKSYSHCQMCFKSVPKCYKSYHSSNKSYLIMENLLHQNYQTVHPTNPLKLKQSLQILDSLAKLHAVSFILREKQPIAFFAITEKLHEPLFQEEMRSSFGKLFVPAIHDALKLSKCSLPEGSIYIDKLSDFTLNVFDKMVQMAQKGPVDYKVITHGDLRNSNILIRYDEDENAITSCFLDFQACRYSSPAHDLAFFLLLSLDKPTRRNNYMELIRRYHGTLCAYITQFGCDPLELFPMSALLAELSSQARFGVGLALAGLPFYMDEGEMFEASDGSSLEENLTEVTRQIQRRKSMKCKNKIMDVVMDAVDLGWL